MSPGRAQLEMRAEIEACTRALEEDKAILSALESEQAGATGSTRRLSMELRQLQESMGRMRLEGRQGTEEYQEMAQRVVELADTIGDLRTQTNILAHDDAGLQGAISGINGLSGGIHCGHRPYGRVRIRKRESCQDPDKGPECHGCHHGAAAGHEHTE